MEDALPINQADQNLESPQDEQVEVDMLTE